MHAGCARVHEGVFPEGQLKRAGASGGDLGGREAGRWGWPQRGPLPMQLSGACTTAHGRPQSQVCANAQATQS